MRKSRWAFFLVCIMTMTGLAGCKGTEKIIPVLVEPAGVKLDTVKVVKDDIFTVKTYSGEVVPYVESLNFVTSGKLKEYRVSLGEEVEEGQILAVYEGEDLQEQIQATKEKIEELTTLGEYSDAQALLDIEIAREELAQMRERNTVWQTTYSKELDIEMMQLKLEQSKELRALELEEQKHLLDNLQKEVAGNEIRAPFSGKVVYRKQLKEGASVNAYDPVICIADEGKLSISTDFISKSEVQAADLITAQILDKEYEVTNIPYSESEYISMVIAGKKMKSSFVVNDAEAKLVSGQFAALSVKSNYKEGCLTIPVNALYHDQKGSYVYLIEGDKRFRRDVETGITTEVKVEIVSGLKEGDEILLSEEMLQSKDANYKTVTVEPGEYRMEVTGSARLVYPVTKQLVIENEGARIKEITVRSGRQVKAGDVLATYTIEKSLVDLESMKLSLKRAQEKFEAEKINRQATIAKMQEEAALLKDICEYRIAEYKIQKQYISYDQYVYQTEKTLAKQKEKLEEAEAQVSDGTIIAPFDGVIDEIASYSTGDRIDKGTVLMTMYSPDMYWVEVSSDTKSLRYNMEVTVSAGSKNNIQTYKGTVVSSPSVFQGDVQEDVAYIALNEFVESDKLAMNLKFEGVSQLLYNVITLDRSLLEREDGKTYVYLLNEGKLQKQYVVEGSGNVLGSWIVDGLSAGQTVVVD